MGQKGKTISIILGDLSQRGAGRWEGGSTRPFILARSLEIAGYDVEIVGFNWGSAEISSFAGFKCRVIKGCVLPMILFSMILNLKKIQGDIVYAYKPQLSSFGFGLLKKLVSRKPLFLDIDDWELSWHGGDNWRYKFSPRKFISDIIRKRGGFRDPHFPAYIRFMEKLISYADQVTTHSTFLQNRFGGVNIANSKDTEHFNPNRYDKSLISEEYEFSQYKILMFAGAPRPYKGIEDALRAVEIINQEDLKLVIVGGSPYDDYDSYLQEKWGKWIIQLPPHSYEEMPKLIAAADIMLIPQRETDETRGQFPLKLTDAMSMAKPLIATRVGDIPTIVADTGYLVDPESPEQLAEQISWIFDNYSEASERARSARLRCQELYSLEKTASDLDKLITNFLI